MQNISGVSLNEVKNFVFGDHSDFVCNSIYINTLKLQQISLITKSIDIYNSSNSRYLTFFLFLLFVESIVDFRRDSAMSLEQSQSSFYKVVGYFARNICNIGYKV